MDSEPRFVFDEASIADCPEITDKADSILEENEEKRKAQLQNFQNKDKDENKVIYKAIISQFGELLLTVNTQEERIKTVMTEDCEIFLFNFADIPVEYAFRPAGFAKLFKDKRVIRREVKETYVSLKKATGFQICDCEVIDERKGSSVCQFSFEIFSFREDKINKYRVIYGCMPMSYDPASLFVPTRKERVLAKVKELNYAWADQPDLERIASLMHESTEFKMWRWEDNKCFVFDKKNLVSEFRKSLEEEFVITSVVPYGVSCEAQYVIGSYVYHLKSRNDGQKYIWVSKCVFMFDQEFNIKKMSLQGEFYLENETVIPFQAHSFEKVMNKMAEVKRSAPPQKKELSIFHTDEIMNFSFDMILFGFQHSSFTGHIKGLSEFSILQQFISNKDMTLKKKRIVELYQDIDDPCYDSVIGIMITQGRMNREDCPSHGKLINFFNVGKVSLENGKFSKIVFFASPIPDPIPSPFDDGIFTEINIKPKSEFSQFNE